MYISLALEKESTEQLSDLCTLVSKVGRHEQTNITELAPPISCVCPSHPSCASPLPTPS